MAGIREGRALVCRGIKFNMRVTTDLASRSHGASVSGSKEKQGCSSDLARGRGGHICEERLKGMPIATQGSISLTHWLSNLTSFLCLVDPVCLAGSVLDDPASFSLLRGKQC